LVHLEMLLCESEPNKEKS